jgi:hypothetical protein
MFSSHHDSVHPIALPSPWASTAPPWLPLQWPRPRGRGSWQLWPELLAADDLEVFSRGHIWVVHIMHSIVPYYTILYITYIHIYNYIYIYTYWTLYLLFFGVRYENLCFFWWSHKNICYSIKTYVFSDPHVLRCFNMFQLSPMGFDSINIHIYSCPKGLIFLQDGCYRTCSGSGHIPRWWLKLNIISIGQVGMGGTK